MVSSETTGDPSRDASPSATTGASTPRRKEKKKVGFHQNEGHGPTSIVVHDGTSQQQILTLQPTAATGGSPDPFKTPQPSPPELSVPQQEEGSPITPTGAPDATELRRALTKILTTQDEAQGARGRQGRSPSVGPSNAAPPEPAVFKSPQRPMRPVLRRDTSYDVHEERVKADLAEMHTGEREQRSRAAARERAHNLAVRVENYASPHASHRPSMDSEDDLEAGSRAARATALDANNNSENMQQDVRSRKLQRKNSHLAPEVLEPAKNLVRAHTKRAQKHHRASSSETQPDGYFAFQPPSEARSGAVTPEPVHEYVQDYVPKPNRYHGGILGSLLKLYNESTGSGSNSRSSTPAHTPQHSPPGSNAPSTPGSPRPSRPSSGIWSGFHVGGSPGPGNVGGNFKTHHKSHSASSLALGELIKSTSTLMAPGSSTSGKGFADRVRQSGQNAKRRSGIFGTDSPKSAKLKKPKQAKGDQHHRITRHIAKILSRHRYVLKLCRALMMYGAPTHRLEEFLTMSARILEIEGQFLYLPGCMIISFDDSATHTTEVKIVRQKHGLNLGKLRDVHIIYKEVVHDIIGVEEATTRLDEILKQDVKFGDWARIPIYGLASASVAPFAFGARLIDLPLIFGLGCLLGWMQLILAPSNYLYANVFEITAAIVTSFLARMFGSIRGGELFCFSAMAQSSIALILPGYMVLSAALELQSHNIVAGSVRMVYAMIYTLFLGYGITIGTAIYGILDRKGATSSTHCNGGIDTDWYFLFVISFTVCLCIINQAKWKQMPVMVAISLLGYVVNLYSGKAFPGGQVSNMLGAFTIGILANMYSRLGRHVSNYYLDFLDWWDVRVRPRFQSASRRRNGVIGGGYEQGATESVPPSPSFGPTSTTEKPTEGSGEAPDSERRRNVGYGLAAAAMLPGIFVQVPGGLAAGGSLLAGLSTANEITRSNSTITTVVNGTLVNVTASSGGSVDAASAALGLGSNLNSTAFSVLFNVIQVAIGITVGLFLSSLVVYPFGKRRSGLLSF